MRRVLTTFGLFDDIADVAAVGRAWSNCVWSVSTTGGCYAVKEMLNPWNDPLWREWLEEAIAFEESAIAAGVRAPRLILTPDGAALADVDDRTFRVHEWIEDAAPCSDGPVPVELARAVARDLASMHALHVAPGRTDVFPAPSTATCDGWPDLLAELHRSGSPHAAAAERATSDIAAVRGWFAQRLVANGRHVMSHGDVDQKNLLLTGWTPWLVDWDVAAPWVAGEEALRTALSLADWRGPALVRAFLASYNDAGGAAVALMPEALSISLIIGIDWLDRCLRIAAGLQDADPQRVEEARTQVPAQLREMHAQVAIVADLPRWLSDRSS